MKYLPYTGNSQEGQWEYLDKIEMLPLDMDSHTDVPEVIDEISKTIAGLNLLVERYCHSPSAYIVTYVVAAVSHYSRDLTGEPFPATSDMNNLSELIIKLLDNIRWRVMSPDSLSGLLGMIQRLVKCDYWSEKQFPPALVDLLQRCLKFGWVNDAKATAVKLAAIHTLTELCKKKAAETNFSDMQIEWFRSEASYLALKVADDEYFAKAVAEFLKYLG
jgi:hypothetical protein